MNVPFTLVFCAHLEHSSHFVLMVNETLTAPVKKMHLDRLEIINEEFHSEAIVGIELDKLLANGWRHFGALFFRYNLNFYRGEIVRVIPLRIRLSDFAVSKSQRRVLKKNKDLRVENRPIKITEESENLFHRHKQRFDHAVPDSIYNFLSHQPATVPCEARELAVYLDEKLIASTYYDIGKNSISAIYSIFDPRHQNRSLGIFLLLNGINYAIESRKEFLYHGYCYDRSSFYDYKKRFIGTEDFDWKSSWISIDRNF